jgi:hypothetical protein
MLCSWFGGVPVPRTLWSLQSLRFHYVHLLVFLGAAIYLFCMCIFSLRGAGNLDAGFASAAVLGSWLWNSCALRLGRSTLASVLSLTAVSFARVAGVVQISWAVPGLPIHYPPWLGFLEAPIADSAGVRSLEFAFSWVPLMFQYLL